MRMTVMCNLLYNTHLSKGEKLGRDMLTRFSMGLLFPLMVKNAHFGRESHDAEFSYSYFLQKQVQAVLKRSRVSPGHEVSAQKMTKIERTIACSSEILFFSDDQKAEDRTGLEVTNCVL